MRVLFLYGLPASGKLTVARELAVLTGYKLFHNHLVVDLLLSVFDFGSPAFVELRESIWLSIFEQAARSDVHGLIFTFAPEKTVRSEFLPHLTVLLASAAAEIDFIELTCPLDEIKHRLIAESRQGYGKLTSLSHFEQLLAEDAFTMDLPRPRLSIDTSAHTPAQAAQSIVRKLDLMSM